MAELLLPIGISAEGNPRRVSLLKNDMSAHALIAGQFGWDAAKYIGYILTELDRADVGTHTICTSVSVARHMREIGESVSYCANATELEEELCEICDMLEAKKSDTPSLLVLFGVEKLLDVHTDKCKLMLNKLYIEAPGKNVHLLFVTRGLNRDVDTYTAMFGFIGIPGADAELSKQLRRVPYNQLVYTYHGQIGSVEILSCRAE